MYEEDKAKALAEFRNTQATHRENKENKGYSTSMDQYQNTVTLTGYSGTDAEVWQDPLNAKFRLRTSQSYKDTNGNWQIVDQWHTIVCWGKLAEQHGKFVRKGHKISVTGQLKYNT